MSEVYYDGQLVTFQGPAPKNLGEVVDLLHRTASASGRALISVQVDNVEILNGQADLLANNFLQVKAATASEKELFARAIDATIAGLPDSEGSIDRILESLLSDSWSVAFEKLNSYLQSLGGFFELLANLEQYAAAKHVNWGGELVKSLKALEGSFGKILSQSETHQVADLTGELNNNFRSVYQNAVELVKGTVRGSFN